MAYSQTAIIVTCGGRYAQDDHCGTFLELHMATDNSYVQKEEVLSEVKVRTENVTVSNCFCLFCKGGGMPSIVRLDGVLIQQPGEALWAIFERRKTY